MDQGTRERVLVICTISEIHSHSIGTTKKGIGPAYSGKASRSGLRVHHLFDQATFADKFRKIVEGRFKRYGHFEYDTEGEIERYKVLSPTIFQLDHTDPIIFRYSQKDSNPLL